MKYADLLCLGSDRRNLYLDLVVGAGLFRPHIALVREGRVVLKCFVPYGERYVAVDAVHRVLLQAAQAAAADLGNASRLTGADALVLSQLLMRLDCLESAHVFPATQA